VQDTSDAVVVSVCPSVCHTPVLCQNVGLRKQRHTTGPGTLVFDAKDLDVIISVSYQVAASALFQWRSAVAPKCLGTELSWVQSVRLPFL